MAELDLCSLGDVKAWLGIPDATTSSDALLARLITAASATVQAEGLLGPLLEADYDERFDGTGATVQLVRHRPVQQVHGVLLDGVRIPRSDDDRAPGFYWDAVSVMLRGYRFQAAARGGVRIQYTAGYASDAIPADLAHAVIETVGLVFKERGDRIGIASKTLGPETVTYVQTAFTTRARDVLERYRSRVPL